MENDKQLWESALVEIELNISRANFSTWFKDTDMIKIEDGIIYLSVPNQVTKEWLFRKFHKFIIKTLRSMSENIRGVEYIVSIEQNKNASGVKKPYEINNAELPLSDFYINKDDNLNPRYTFANFVVGTFNELAHAASQAIVDKPGVVYNPFFIYGNTGHGKTHLIQAIGNHLKNSFGGKKVYYISAEKFALDFVNAVQENKRNVFKEKYRKYDVFIMDDVQFLAKQEKTQEELFHLFNTLYDNNKQIIFSSDKHPNYIPNLESRLKSRFGAGMIVDIPEPDHESRLAIIKTKIGANNIYLNEDTMSYIATATNGNIRELEGAVNTVICQSKLKNRELTLLEVKNLLKEHLKPKRNLSIKEIVKIIADFYSIEEESIYEKTRKKEVVKPRQIIMFILREDFRISFPTIGEKLGGRDHTTVIHSCDKMKNDVKLDVSLSGELQQIRALLK